MPNINDSINWAVAKCNDPNVGYSQAYRNQQTVGGITYYDCSSFIWYALIAGGFDCVTAYGQSYPFVTDTMNAVLLALGFQTVDRTGELKPGDICLKTGHTEMVYEGGSGTARTMGAHTSQYPLERQVSINDYWTSGTSWDTIYRYGEGGDTQVFYGIDISQWNGDINWSITKDNIDFAIIRAGYGLNHIDTKFIANADGCTQYNIPFGIYWFSYATSLQDCIDEADYCCSVIQPYSLSYPIFFDWEYDSEENYKNTHGSYPTNEIREQFAKAFMDRIIQNGYDVGLYTNYDYINYRGFGFILNQNTYQLWYSHPYVDNPEYDCQIWQYSWVGSIPGITTDVDLDKTTGLTPKPPVDNKFKWWIYLRFLPF